MKVKYKIQCKNYIICKNYVTQDKKLCGKCLKSKNSDSNSYMADYMMKWRMKRKWNSKLKRYI